MNEIYTNISQAVISIAATVHASACGLHSEDLSHTACCHVQLVGPSFTVVPPRV